MKNTAPAKKTIFNKPISIIIPGAAPKDYGFPHQLRLGNGVSLLEDQVAKVKGVFSAAEFIYTVGPGIDILNFPAQVKLCFNPDVSRYSDSYSVGVALLNSPLNSALVIYGDVFFDPVILTVVESIKSTNSCAVFTSEQPKENPEQIGLRMGKSVEHFYYGLPRRWVQIFYISGECMRKFVELALAEENRGKLVFEIFNLMIDAGIKIEELPIMGAAWDVDDIRGARRLKEIV